MIEQKGAFTTETAKLYWNAANSTSASSPPIPDPLPPGVFSMDLAAAEENVMKAMEVNVVENPSPPTLPGCTMAQAWDKVPNYARGKSSFEASWKSTVSAIPRAKATIRTRGWLIQHNALVEAHFLSPPELGFVFLRKRPADYRTQKVRGVVALKYGITYYCIARGPEITGIIQDFPDLIENGRWIAAPHVFPCFARPCPVQPRHGFVDSVAVFDAGQVLDVLAAAKKADKGAELLLMPLLSSRYSGVITTAGVALGMGNAGATSGGSRSVFIPAPVDLGKRAEKINADSAGVTDSPYIEFVENNFAPVLVQIRNGPPPPGGGSPNWIPRKVEVREIITPRMGLHFSLVDLMEWESPSDAVCISACFVQNHTTLRRTSVS